MRHRSHECSLIEIESRPSNGFSPTFVIEKMKFPQILPTLIASLSLISCATQSGKNVRSPSGRFEVNYGEASLEQDASYGILDRLNGGGYSICSGNDTPLNESTFMWSPSELTWVIIQNGETGHPDRFVLAQHHALPEPDWCLLHLKPLQQRIFDGKQARLISVSDTGIGFRIGESTDIRQIRLEDLEKEAQWQKMEYDPNKEMTVPSKPSDTI